MGLFTQLNPSPCDFLVPERLIWLGIKGNPLRSWSPKSFIKVDSKWINVVYMILKVFTCASVMYVLFIHEWILSMK